MPPASQRITLLSATSLASVVAVAAGVQPAEGAVVYQVQIRNPDEVAKANNSTSTPLSLTDVLGNAVPLATTNPAYTLVGTTASRTITVTRRTSGQTGTTTLSVSTPTTAASATYAVTLSGATLNSSNRTRTISVGVTPTERSGGSTISGSFTLTGTNPNNNASSTWSYTSGTADKTDFTFQTIAVSAVASQTANATVYALPGSTTTQAFTVQNIGDGTLAGTDTSTFKTELWGKVSVTNGANWSGSGVSAFDSTGTNLGNSASRSSTFTYTAASTRGTSSTASITGTYTSGGKNNTGSTAVTVLTGTTVAPQNATAATGTTLYALPGKAASGTFNIQNVGDGSYVGASLTGTLTTTTATGFTGSVANGAFSLADGKAPSTPAATTLTQTLTYTGQGTRGASVAATVTASFSNGNSSGTNAAETVTKVFTGQTVAPVASTTTSATSLGAVRVGTSATGSFTVKNIGDGNLAGADDGSTVLTNLRGNVSVNGSGFSGGGAVNLADASSQSYMFTYAPTARGSLSGTITAALTNGAANGSNNATNISSTVTGTAVGPDYDGAVAGTNASSGAIINGGTILFGEPVGGLTLQDLLISNISNDVAAKSLTDLTLTNVTITGSTEFSFSLSGFDSGNTAGFGTSASNAVLSNLANGDGKGAIAIQFVNKAGTGTAQLRIETDEGAALGGAGAIYVYNLVWAVPEPGTIAVFGAGLLGLAISRQRRRGRAFAALTAKPEEEDKPPSAR